MSEGKFYWLKLKRDFFKRHDIRIIESMPNGKDYILFYLKLLCESVDHEGSLRFNDRIPYNEDMLSTITSTNVDTVRSAIKVFTELQMMEIMDDGTYFMSEVQNMIGSAADNGNANRQRRFREKQKQLALAEPEVPQIEEKKPVKRFTPPTLDEVKAYCEERHNNVDAEQWLDFYSAKNFMIGKNKMKDWKAAVRTWERNDNKQNKGSGVKIPKPEWWID